MRKFVQATISEEIHTNLKILGAIRGEKLSKIIEEAIEKYLKLEETKKEIENHGK